MKRIGALIAVISLLLGQSMALAEPTITSSLLSRTTVEESWNDAFGVAKSTRTITSKVKRVSSESGQADITSVTETTQVIQSSWRGGGLKINTVDGNSTTTGSDGSSATSHFWADYRGGYDASGKLAYADKITGGANSVEIDDKGNKTTSHTDNFYTIKNGEAVESGSVTTGKTVESDGTQISHFTVTTNNNYDNKGRITSSVTQTRSDGDGESAGTSSTTTRTTTYNRDADGVLTGLTLQMSGSRRSQNGEGGFIEETLNWAKSQYTVSYDLQQGYYFSYEKLIWDAISKEPHDPWTKGTLTMVDGHLAFVVNPDDVDGNSFYKMDPSKVTGETKENENGNMIFMLAVEDGKTYNELKSRVGQEVNLMWQYYTKSSDGGASGYGWIHLAPTSDGRVASHLKNDSVSQVQQWGGNWDRSKQYVVIE